MVSRVNTGVPFPGGAVNVPGYEQQSANTFFGPTSTSLISHQFSVDESPYYIKAFGLGDSGFIELVMVTKTPTTDYSEQMRLNGNAVHLTEMNNCLVIDIPGVYQLQLSGGLGSVICVGGPTSLSYWSWGLKAFALSTSGG